MALFPTHYTLTQGSLHYRLATLGYQKRNTYGVEIFIRNIKSVISRQNPWRITLRKRNTGGVGSRKSCINPG